MDICKMDYTINNLKFLSIRLIFIIFRNNHNPKKQTLLKLNSKTKIKRGKRRKNSA